MAVARPSLRACARPAASGRLDSTSATSAGYSDPFAASISAVMLEPRPEIRTATRFLSMRLPGEIEMSGKADTRAVPGDRHDRPELCHRFPAGGEGHCDRIGAALVRHHHHADPAVEGAQHLRFGNASGAGEPFEHG